MRLHGSQPKTNPCDDSTQIRPHSRHYTYDSNTIPHLSTSPLFCFTASFEATPIARSIIFSLLTSVKVTWVVFPHNVTAVRLASLASAIYRFFWISYLQTVPAIRLPLCPVAVVNTLWVVTLRHLNLGHMLPLPFPAFSDYLENLAVLFQGSIQC